MAASSEFGVYLPTTDDFDIDAIRKSNLDDPVKDLLIRLYESYNNIANVVNVKESAYYLPTEFLTGAQWFQEANAPTDSPTRSEYRQVVNVGPLLDTDTKRVAHNIPDITSATTFLHCFGMASDTTGLTYLPLPYVSATAPIEVSVDVDNVYITTTSNRTNYNKAVIVLLYLKN